MPTDSRTPGSTQWLRALEVALENAGTRGVEAVRYIRAHRVRIALQPQSAGARWTMDGRIEIHPRFASGPVISSYGLSLLIHEVRHLQQGALTALSVYGELDAWQLQFRFLSEHSIEIPGSELHRASIRELLALPLGWDREALTAARRLMRIYGGRAYRVDLLPLYPIQREIAYMLTRRAPSGP